MSDPRANMRKPVNAILYTAGGCFEDVFLDRGDTLSWISAMHRLIGAESVIEVGGALGVFVEPFRILVDAAGAKRRRPSAVVIDLESETGTNLLHGSALIFRPAGKISLGAVQKGDMALIQSLPWWLRFDRLQRRTSLPTIAQLTASGAVFAPQINLALAATPRRQMVFINALIGRYEHDIVALDVIREPESAKVRLMLFDEVVDDALRFIKGALDEEGQLAEPWASV